jgi:HK97 family phage major capsid protein
MDSIGASKVPVVLGDLSYWATRLITDDSSGIRVYQEAPGLVEKGNVGFRCFLRADGGLLYTDSGSASPFITIRCHS